MTPTTKEAEMFLRKYDAKRRQIKLTKIGKGAALTFASMAASLLLIFGLQKIAAPQTEQPAIQYVAESIEPATKTEVAPITPSVLYTASADSTKRITLPDGSIVVLNGNSRLIQCEDFGKDERKVVLRGEAYFDVAKDSKRFVVETRNEKYIVHGTSFNIFAATDNRHSIVTLHSGKLEAKVKDNTYMLMPGEELRIDEQENNISKHNVNVANSISWMNKELKFSHLPLKYVASQISHKYGVKINIHSSIENMTYTGELHNEPLSVAMRLLTITASVELSVTEFDGEYYISKKKKDNI